MILGAVLLVLVAVAVAVVRDLGSSAPRAQAIMLPNASRSYLGLYERSTISSYAGVDHFAHAIGRQPNIVSSYIGWGESFQTSFATAALRHGAVPLVQIDPENIRCALSRPDGMTPTCVVSPTPCAVTSIRSLSASATR